MGRNGRRELWNMSPDEILTLADQTSDPFVRRSLVKLEHAIRTKDEMSQIEAVDELSGLGIALGA